MKCFLTSVSDIIITVMCENGVIVHISDCGTLTVVNGQFTAASGTTLGETATQSCNTGYTFSGDATVTCTDSGWSGAAATCTIVGM